MEIHIQVVIYTYLTIGFCVGVFFNWNMCIRTTLQQIRDSIKYKDFSKERNKIIIENACLIIKYTATNMILWPHPLFLVIMVYVELRKQDKKE